MSRMDVTGPDQNSQVKVSVIIPCYNQGKWLWDAIDSVLVQDMDDFEIIVVNDGSTDPITNRIVASIEHPKITALMIANQGLAGARNEGINQAKGCYILPLDADDRFHPSYLRKASEVLDQFPDTGIVYCRAELFGEQQGIWNLDPYKFPDILISPQIFASSMYRRSDWEKVGGYKRDMIYGWEDYEFWLSLIETGVGVHQIEEVLFYYRKTTGSMAGLDRKRMLYSFRRLYEHHRGLYEANIEFLFNSAIDQKPLRDAEKLSESDIFDVFIPTSEGYSQEGKREQSYPEAVWTRIAILLNEYSDSGIHQLRLDPARNVCVIDIASIRLLQATSGSVVKEWANPVEFESVVMGKDIHCLPHERFLRLFCSGRDGYFYLPKIEREILEQPVVLEVWILKHQGLNSLGEFCASRNEELKAEKSFSALREQLLAYEKQSIELKAELQRQIDHSAELERIRDALNIRADSLRAQSEHSRLLVQTLESEIRQLTTTLDCCETMKRSQGDELNAARSQIRSLEEQLASAKRRKGWFRSG